MKYVQFKISINDDYQEALIAELEEMDFEGYRQFDDEMIAYISQKNIQIGDRERIEQLLAVYPGQNFIQTEKIEEEKNWNSEWEQTIQPQKIGKFLVRPTWVNKQAAEGQILLEIDPKMAFGTGYHATTRLLLKMLPQFIKEGDTVLDAGTGTGILAIAAVKIGAKKVIAFDTDERSVLNATENVFLNGVNKAVEIKHGSLETAQGEEKFDVILVNINKNAIKEMIAGFSKLLNRSGVLLLSGLLKRDEEDIKNKLRQYALKPIKTKLQEEWLAICAKKQVAR